MTWAECGACGRVLNENDLPDLDAIDAPCPRCDAAGEARALWPPYETSVFLNTVDEFDDATDGKHLRIRALFLASACENLMGEILWDTMVHLRVPARVAEHTIRSASGRDRLVALYKMLTGTSAQKVLEDAGMGTWSSSWTRLAEARNTYGHGKWGKPRVGDRDAAEAGRVVRESFSLAFAELKNFAVDAVQSSEDTP